MSIPRGRLPGVVDQARRDMLHVSDEVKVSGRPKMSRLELALTLLDDPDVDDADDGLRSPNLDGTGRGGGGAEIDDPEHPDRKVTVPLTSVEAGAVARVEGRRSRRQHSRQLEREILEAAEEAEAATRRLRFAILKVTATVEAETTGKEGTDTVWDGTKWRPACRWHGQVMREGDEPRIGDRNAGPLVADAGEEPPRIPVCKSCHTFASRHLRAPSIAELQHHRDRGKWPKVHHREAS
ncbi:MAG: hypothetical protein AAGA17_00235 [Actinomycetota bacterium]